MELNHSREANSQSRISSPFIETEGLLPCSQGPTTGPYPESDESNPHPHMNTVSLRPILILYCVYEVVLLLGFPCPTHLSFFDLITLIIHGEEYKL